MNVALNGTFFVSEQLYKGSESETIEQGQTEPMKVVVGPSTNLLVPVRALLHRTVNLGSFESARITVALTAFSTAEHTDAAFDECVRLAQVWLDEEVAKVTKQPVDKEAVMHWTLKGVPALIVEIDYGLTLNMGNYESARADVGRAVPCLPEDAQACCQELRQWLKAKTKERVIAIRTKYQSAAVGSPL